MWSVLPPLCVWVYIPYIHLSAVSENENGAWRRAETRKDKQTISLPCLTVTHFLHSQNKQAYLKHQASSYQLSSSSHTEMLSSVKKMSPGSALKLCKVVTVLLNLLGQECEAAKRERAPYVIKSNWCRQVLSQAIKRTLHPSRFNQHQTCSEAIVAKFEIVTFKYSTSTGLICKQSCIWEYILYQSNSLYKAFRDLMSIEGG